MSEPIGTDEMLDRIEELKLAVRYEADLAQQALDARKELETKLAAKEKLMLALAGDKIDLVSELAGVKGKLAKAREDALREAADRISHHGSRNDIYSKSRNDAASAILSLIEQETPNE